MWFAHARKKILPEQIYYYLKSHVDIGRRASNTRCSTHVCTRVRVLIVTFLQTLPDRHKVWCRSDQTNYIIIFLLLDIALSNTRGQLLSFYFSFIRFPCSWFGTLLWLMLNFLWTLLWVILNFLFFKIRSMLEQSVAKRGARGKLKPGRWPKSKQYLRMSQGGHIVASGYLYAFPNAFGFRWRERFRQLQRPYYLGPQNIWGRVPYKHLFHSAEALWERESCRLSISTSLYSNPASSSPTVLRTHPRTDASREVLAPKLS